MTPNSLGEGVYYDYDAYAGFLRRLAVVLIDVAVLVVSGFLLLVAVAFGVALIAVMADWSADASAPTVGVFLATWAFWIWLYLTVIKRSRWRTIGYRLTGLKIVTTRGTRPSLLTMTFRLLLWIFGPFHFLFDLLWLGADCEEQSLRDCYAGTYVVRTSAEPIGTAPMHLVRYHAAGMTLVYPRVTRPKQSLAGDQSR